MNKTIISGRLVKDPETSTAGSTTVTKYTVAVDRDYTDKDGNRPTDFLNCESWGKSGEFVSKWFKKGDAIVVCGKSRCDSYQTENGTRYKNYIAVDEVDFCGTRKSKTNDDTEKPANAAAENTSAEPEDNDNLPF